MPMWSKIGHVGDAAEGRGWGMRSALSIVYHAALALEGAPRARRHGEEPTCSVNHPAAWPSLKLRGRASVSEGPSPYQQQVAALLLVIAMLLAEAFDPTFQIFIDGLSPVIRYLVQ